MGGSSSAGCRALLALAAFFLFACLASGRAEEPATLRVVVTLFPQYDFARQIAGGKAAVRLLLPPGAESHSYEPTPSDMKEIAAADLFVYTGPHMEPWAKRLADSVSRPGGVTIVDASVGIRYRGGDEPHKHEDDGEDDDHGHGHSHEFDPHIWLDPTLAAVMADNIARALAERDPANADTYAANAQALRRELEEMGAQFQKTVAAAPRRVLVFGERFAFAYFFDRYGLEEVGAYRSCAPGVEPGLKAVLEVIDFVRKNNVRHIYREVMSSSRISKVITEETDTTELVVDSLHNLPAGGNNQDYTYQNGMRLNMAQFAKGLE